ncbi:AAA family ATPase [Caloramator sp. CAR-1]|uniref:ParA family protein n=1 Tax=Caloramator sp. CAR-1 TaxID=3062777 RepID=UPI0026E1EF9D|nr:AAA family ATPase [Caloramator sp. CAR-1]MDO6355260.1 AAA family ATPase [Caloramator sp. CAR-1]
MVAKVISFINMKGGVAKTTLTLNIGNRLSQLGNRVLIVDMDPQFNATQSLLLYINRIIKSDFKQNIEELTEEVLIQEEISSSKYYEQLSKNRQTVLQVFESTNIDKPLSDSSLAQKITDNLFLIPGDLTLTKEIAGDTSGKVGALLSHFDGTNILNDYDYVLIDCPPTWSILTHASLFASDYYVIPSKVDIYSLIGIELLQDQIKNKITEDKVYQLTKRTLKQLGIVFTLVHRDLKIEEGMRNYIINYFNDTIHFFQNDLPYIPSVPTKFIMFDEAQNDSRYSQLINSIEKITNEMLNRLNIL